MRMRLMPSAELGRQFAQDGLCALRTGGRVDDDTDLVSAGRLGARQIGDVAE